MREKVPHAYLYVGNISRANQPIYANLENYRSGPLDADPMDGVRGFKHKKKEGGWGA